MFEQLGLIGCGLMGSSFALALKRAGLVRRVVGYSKSSGTTERARSMGVIDAGASTASMAALGSDIVLLAIPVSATEATFEAIRPCIGAATLVMDVGSTKRDVVEAACRALQDQVGAFVACHPITGKEVSGVEHADVNLYQGKQVILTPIETTLHAQLQQATDIWTALGCQVIQMSPQAHDAAYAAVSHLPHLIAFAFMNGIKSQARGQDFMALAGPGFRDFTRIAASNPEVWRDILLANREELLAQSKIFQQCLLALEAQISGGTAEALESGIRQASETRATWRVPSHNFPK
ncbi:MAG: prephenate dehydrogenase [Polaromonas sp.]|jgi:prephenate dehydrogenase|nr:prephenate dehydrogenase [Polaromonas sp.]